MPGGYTRAGQAIGNSIADAMIEYHKEHQHHDRMYGAVDALSRIIYVDKNTGRPAINPMTDESGKPINKDLVSPFNTKLLEQYKNFNRREAARQEGGMDAIGKLLGGLGQQAMKQREEYPVQVGSQTIMAPAAAAVRAGVEREKMILRMLPKQAQAPTGGQLLAEQRAQRNFILKQQKEIGDRLLIQSAGGQNITDPNLLLDDANIAYGSPGKLYGFTVKPADQSTHALIRGGKDDGSDLQVPIKQFKRLRGEAEKWRDLGAQAEALTQQQATFNQAWGGLNPTQQQVASQKLLGNPTPQMKAFFDQKFGAGASDILINAAGKAKPSSTPEPESEAEDAAEPGEEEDNAGDYGN